jgi:aminoglycoside 3-N-acetyltransferase
MRAPGQGTRTPSQTVGAVAELFRTQPGAHPHRSITANGPLGASIYDLDCPAGGT